MKKEIFKEFEKGVIERLLSNVLLPEVLAQVVGDAEFVSYEYNPYGYFLTVRHSSLPEDRVVCSEPMIVGKSGSIECGFVVFLENKELTFEIYTWGDTEIPEDFRERNIELREISED